MTADLIDTLAGISADSPLGQLRRERADIFRHTQGSHAVLITPAEPGGVSLAERAAVALLVAEYDDDAALAAHYRALVDQAGGMPQGARWDAILVHTDMVAGSPGSARAEDLVKLQARGLSPQDIVVVSQIIAFAAFQVRLLAGLRMLQQKA
jgi:uncharacterized protein YciW